MAFTTVNSEFWVERLVARGYRQKDSLEVIGATGDFFTSHGEKPMFMRTQLFRILAHRLGTPERNFSSIITPVELAIGVSEYVEPIRWFNYVSRLLETSPFLFLLLSGFPHYAADPRGSSHPRSLPFGPSPAS